MLPLRIAAAPLMLLSAALAAAAPLAATPPPPSPPAALATELASSIAREMKRIGARTARVELRADTGLEASPAESEIARVLVEALFAEGGFGLRADPSPSPERMDGGGVTISLRFARHGGALAVGGPLARDGRTEAWAFATAAENDAWIPWLVPAETPPPDRLGYTWRRVGTLPGEALDADAGDVDGDGRAELAVATHDELLVYSTSPDGPVRRAAVRFDEGPAVGRAPIATRAPRTFARVVASAGGAGEVHVRRGGEARTRVYAWRGGGLERRADRDGIVLASRWSSAGEQRFSAELEPGTNHFVERPWLPSAGGARTARTAWLDLREAEQAAAARLDGASAAFGLLDGRGAIALLRGDLKEVARVVGCGSAYALADWDADGRTDVLCAGRGSEPVADTVTLTAGSPADRPLWSATVDGEVAAIAAAPGPDATAALVLVRPPGGGHTALWYLRRRP